MAAYTEPLRHKFTKKYLYAKTFFNQNEIIFEKILYM